MRVGWDLGRRRVDAPATAEQELRGGWRPAVGQRSRDRGQLDAWGPMPLSYEG